MQKDLTVNEEIVTGPILIADQIEKPGNLGSMIRTAKSLGMENIFCSDEITDFYNPNVIRASIGHLFTMNLVSDTTKKIINLLEKNKYQIILMDPESENLINDFKPENLAKSLHEEFDEFSNDQLQESKNKVSIAGRIMLKRVMGKASFVQLQDTSDQI